MTAENQRNVDDDEIAKFSQIADKWWDKNGEFKPLHDINPLRLNYIDRLAPLAGKRVLDVGCGGGNTLARMAERVTEGHLVGIDYSETSVEASRAFNSMLVAAGRMEILPGSVESLPFSDAHFDKVVTVESFYFWPNPSESLKEVARVVKPGGTFLLLAEIYERPDLPVGIREKVEAYELTNPTPEEFERLFRAAGFAQVETHFMDGEYWIAVVGRR